MRKLAVILTISIFLLFVDRTNILYAEQIENNTFEITNYDFITKKETKEVLEKSDLEMDINTMARGLGVELEQITEGYNPGLSEETSNTRAIIGTDNQSKVNVSSYPYSAVLFMVFGHDTDGDGDIDVAVTGTGFLEGHDVVATAGHLIWDHEYGRGWIEDCWIYVKHDSSSYQSNKNYYKPKSWAVPTSFISNFDLNEDWCVMVLEDNLGSENGWFGKGKGSARDLTGTIVTISGYPTDSSWKKYRQYKQIGTIISEVSTNRIKYNIDTENGNSGSPIYDINHIAWGINTLGSSAGNEGVQLSDWMYDLLQQRYLEGVGRWE